MIGSRNADDGAFRPAPRRTDCSFERFSAGEPPLDLRPILVVVPAQESVRRRISKRVRTSPSGGGMERDMRVLLLACGGERRVLFALVGPRSFFRREPGGLAYVGSVGAEPVGGPGLHVIRRQPIPAPLRRHVHRRARPTPSQSLIEEDLVADELIHLVNGQTGPHPVRDEFWSEVLVISSLLRWEPERLPSPGLPDVDSVGSQSATIATIDPCGSRSGEGDGDRPPEDCSGCDGQVCARPRRSLGIAARTVLLGLVPRDAVCPVGA